MDWGLMFYFKPYSLPFAAIGITLNLSGCAVFGYNDKERVKPIANPFYSYQGKTKGDPGQTMILRTKKGDRSVELEIPGDSERLSEFVLPLSPAFKDSGRFPASHRGNGGSTGSDDRIESEGTGGLDDSYKNHSTSQSDREITQSFSHGSLEDQSKLREIEKGLNLNASEDDSPAEGNQSYLASLDHIKQLYKATRYEAALLEIDEMVRLYQTDSRLYEMRGTLLERLGRRELAMKSWSQALRFDPKNEVLRKFIDRKQFRSAAGAP